MMSAMETATRSGGAAVRFGDFRSSSGPRSAGKENNGDPGIGILESRTKVRGTLNREISSPNAPAFDCS